VAPIGACDPAPALRSTLVLPVLVLSAAPANVTALKSASAITPWRRELRMGASFAVYGRKENARQAETLPVRGHESRGAPRARTGPEGPTGGAGSGPPPDTER